MLCGTNNLTDFQRAPLLSERCLFYNKNVLYEWGFGGIFLFRNADI